MHQPFAEATAPHKRVEETTHGPAPASGTRTAGGAPVPVITRARQAEARNHLAAELRAIALDLLGLYEAEEMPRECATWVRTTVEAVVAEVCEPALASLTRSLTSELRQAPAEVARRIDRTRLRHEAGFA